MWFGTCDGLNIFDGSEISLYKSPENKNNLSGNLIEDILETEEGIFWLQTNYGLNRLNIRKKQVDYFPHFSGQTVLRKDKDNTLFIMHDDNYLYYHYPQSGSINKIHVPHLVIKNILNFIIDSSNVMWIFQTNGEIKTYSIIKSGQNMELSLLNTYHHNEKLLYCYYEDDIAYFIDNTYTLFEYNLMQGRKEYIFNLQSMISKRGEVSISTLSTPKWEPAISVQNQKSLLWK